MGLMELLSMFGCPTRNSPSPTAAGASRDGAAKKPVADFRDRQPPKPSAKRSFKKFESSDLNPNAESFRPDGPIVDPNEPEWAQFLAKKAFENRPQEQQRATGVFKKPSAQTKEQPKAPTPVNFALQTSEYLKLLNTDKSSTKSQAQKRQGGQNLDASNVSAESLKMDLAGALDAIIRSQADSQDKKKKSQPIRQPMQDPKATRDATLMRIANMLDAKDEGDTEAEARAVTACDDIGVEKQNRDDDLSELAYWSDDNKAPRATHRASAHKIGNKTLDTRQIRDYVTQKVDADLDRKVAMMLLHLRRLGDRNRLLEPEAPSCKRYVVGLKEVMRGVRNSKVKCIIIAPDIEEVSGSGGLDGRLKDIIAAAYERDLPVIFCLSRTRIGRALGKFLRMSVLAILDVKGCTDLYDSTVELAYQKRVEWLAEQPKKNAAKSAPTANAKVKMSTAPGAKGVKGTGKH